MMSTNALTSPGMASIPSTKIRQIDAAEPLDWLASGVRTFAAAPWASLLYGALFALASALTLYLTHELPGFTVAFLTGLVLIGPFLAAGLYVAARQQEQGQPVRIGPALALLRSRATNLSLFALFLALVMAAWVRISALLFALKFNSFTISTEGYLGILAGSGDPIAISYFVVIGFALAAIVFITSAVAIPMIIDRDCSPVTAIQVSARVFARNWVAMSLWAAFIVALTGIGILTFFAGMLVIFPVLGYATWHSYRRMVA